MEGFDLDFNLPPSTYLFHPLKTSHSPSNMLNCTKSHHRLSNHNDSLSLPSSTNPNLLYSRIAPGLYPNAVIPTLCNPALTNAQSNAQLIASVP